LKLSLSVRAAEASTDKKSIDIDPKTFIESAKTYGYAAVCMRASMLGTHSSREEVLQMRDLLDHVGLEVSMVTGDFAIPINNERGPDCLRKITPYLDLTEQLRSSLIRVCIKDEKDIPHAQRAADEAKERSIRLAHQCHTLSLFETVDGAIDVLTKIDRKNFGLIYEPGNLALCGEDYGPGAIRKLAPYIFNVYLQNHVPEPDGKTVMHTWKMGKVLSTIYPLEAEAGIDFKTVVTGLCTVGYDGYITLHQAFKGDAPPLEAAQRSAVFLRGLLES